MNATRKNGRKVWVVSWFVGGRRHRRFFDSRKVAELEAQTVTSAHGDHADVWASLPGGERDEVLRVIAAAKARGVSLSQVWAEWSKGADRPREECALGVAFKALLESKTKAGRSARYVRNLKHLVGGFVSGRESLPIAGVTVKMVEEHLASRPLRSRATIAARLSTFFEYARRRGWMASNPADHLEAVTVAQAPPEIFTPRQLARALVWFRRRAPRGLAWFVLSTLCGLRPEEAEKTEWGSVNLDGEAFVRVEAQTSKVRQRRVVYPLPAAVAWLRVAKDEGGELPFRHQARRYACRALAAYLRLSGWPKDITRHTAASYWLAASRNPAEVAAQLGNSPGILKAHYDALVTREAAAKVWGLVPRMRGESSKTAETPGPPGDHLATARGDEKAAAH